MKTGKIPTQPNLDWVLVEEKCNQIGKQANIPDLFQTVKKHLIEQTSFALHNHDGFVIVRPLVIDNKKTLQVEVAYSTSKKGCLKYQESIERLAAYLDCIQVEFYTVRKGFDRLAPRLGYVKVPCREHFILWRKHFENI